MLNEISNREPFDGNLQRADLLSLAETGYTSFNSQLRRR